MSDSTILGTPTYAGGSSQDGRLTLMFLKSMNVHSVILNALFFVGSIHRTSFLRIIIMLCSHKGEEEYPVKCIATCICR